MVAPSNGFARIGESGHKLYGPGLGAGVILPKRLLSAALSSTTDGAQYQHLLRDNYETPLYAPTLAGRQIELDDTSLNPHFAYDDTDAKVRHEVWFLDAVTALNQIRVLVATNLVLGIITIAVGGTGRYW